MMQEAVNNGDEAVSCLIGCKGGWVQEGVGTNLCFGDGSSHTPLCALPANAMQAFPPPNFIINEHGQVEHVIERIVGDAWMNNMQEYAYEVKWVGFPAGETTWQLASELLEDGVGHFIDEYRARHPRIAEREFPRDHHDGFNWPDSDDEEGEEGEESSGEEAESDTESFDSATYHRILPKCRYGDYSDDSDDPDYIP